MGGMNSLSLILVMGSAGSGKSTFAQRLVPELGCVYLNSDTVSETAFPADRNSPAYLKARPIIYRTLYNIAFANLKLGNSVLIDAPHVGQISDAGWRAWVMAEAETVGARLRVIHCLADQETRRSRLAVSRRGARRGQTCQLGRVYPQRTLSISRTAAPYRDRHRQGHAAERRFGPGLFMRRSG